jgi:uncharacterized protein (TIGR03067 family)
MRCQVACCLLVAVAFVRWSLAEDKPAKKPDTEIIQGEWRLIYFEEEGEVDPPEKYKSMVLILADGKVTIKVEGKIVVEGKYKLDSSKQPKCIDLNRGEEDGPGIYELDGDKLTICAPAFEMKSDRPKEFKAPKGSGLLLMKLERVKK